MNSFGPGPCPPPVESEALSFWRDGLWPSSHFAVRNAQKGHFHAAGATGRFGMINVGQSRHHQHVATLDFEVLLAYQAASPTVSNSPLRVFFSVPIKASCPSLHPNWKVPPLAFTEHGISWYFVNSRQPMLRLHVSYNLGQGLGLGGLHVTPPEQPFSSVRLLKLVKVVPVSIHFIAFIGVLPLFSCLWSWLPQTEHCGR